MAIERLGSYTITVEDRPGELANVANILKEMGVNLRGLWAFSVGQGRAQIIAVPEDGTRFQQVAEDASWKIKEGSCFRYTAEDTCGALCETLDQVAADGVNLQALDAVSVDGRFAVFFWGEEDQTDTLAKALSV